MPRKLELKVGDKVVTCLHSLSQKIISDGEIFKHLKGKCVAKCFEEHIVLTSHKHSISINLKDEVGNLTNDCHGIWFKVVNTESDNRNGGGWHPKYFRRATSKKPVKLKPITFNRFTHLD